MAQATTNRNLLVSSSQILILIGHSGERIPIREQTIKPGPTSQAIMLMNVVKKILTSPVQSPDHTITMIRRNTRKIDIIVGKTHNTILKTMATKKTDVITVLTTKEAVAKLKVREVQGHSKMDQGSHMR